MRHFAIGTMIALGAIIGLSPAKAFPPPRAPAARVKTVNIPVTFTFNSEVGKVRTMAPPENFDEKGKPKKYTKAELLKLKGDTPAEKKLVGYKSDFSEVKMGDTVQVTISMLKGAAAKKDKPAKAGDADADKPAKEDKPGGKTGKWVVAKTLLGKVTKVSAANTGSEAKMTIQVPTQVLGGGGGAANAQTFDEEKYAATLIVVTVRGPAR